MYTVHCTACYWDVSKRISKFELEFESLNNETVDWSQCSKSNEAEMDLKFGFG